MLVGVAGAQAVPAPRSPSQFVQFAVLAVLAGLLVGPRVSAGARRWTDINVTCAGPGAPTRAAFGVVEILTGAGLGLCLYVFGPTWECLVAAVLVVGAIACGAVDVFTKRIPTAFVARTAIAALGLVLAASLARADATPLFGAIAGAGALAGLLAMCRVMTRGGLGRGDVRLGAALGLVVGWEASNPSHLVTTSLVAAWTAVIVAAALASLTHLAARTGRSPAATLPFAPALAAGALVVLFLP